MSGRPAAAGLADLVTPRLASLREALAPVVLEGATLLGEGWQVTAYQAGEWVIRLPRTALGRETTVRQARLYTLLAAGGLPVPRDARIVRGPDGEVIAGLYRHIPGEPATPARRGSELAQVLGGFLTELHRFPPAGARECCEVVGDLWTGRFEAHWTRCRPHLGPPEREWLEAVIAGFLRGEAGEPATVAVVHGDLAEEHILVDAGGRLQGIIDFNGPRIADPALDFGTLGERFGWVFAQAALDGYGGPVDPGFMVRARFYADVRPLVTIALGLNYGSEPRLRQGLARLAGRMQQSADTA